MKYILFVCCIVIVMSCGDKDPSARYDIYAYGYSAPQTGAPAYWKNGSKVAIGDGSDKIYVSDMAVSGDDVYVAGAEYENGGTGIARYWKNGTPVSLTNGNINAEIAALFVSGTDVYAVGHEGNPWKPKYWKNGVGVTLPYGGEFCGAHGITVVGNDVHIIGVESATDTVYARYWKNGQLQSLTPKTDHAYLSDITSQGNDVYIAGYYNTSAEGMAVKYTSAGTVWKNGTATFLGNLNTKQIAVAGSDVIVTSEQNAAYWKNQEYIEIMADGSGFRVAAGGVSIANGDIIISGVKLKSNNNERLGSYIWVNGEAKEPFTGDDPNIELIGVIAVSR